MEKITKKYGSFCRSRKVDRKEKEMYYDQARGKSKDGGEGMEEGTILFYIDEDEVYCGKAMEVEAAGTGFLFSIDSYGDCAGQYRISSSQIGKTVFFNEEDAIEAVKR